MKSLLVACLNQEANVSVHEINGHSDVFAVGKDGAPICSTLFDEAEDVIPSIRCWLAKFQPPQSLFTFRN